MTGSQFLIFVASVFLLLVGLIVFTKGYRSWIYNVFNAIFTGVLCIIAFFAVDTYFFSAPVKIKTTNYSKKRGQLYFLEGEGCDAEIKYGYTVNANEESWLELGEKAGNIRSLILLAQNDSIYQLSASEVSSRKLDIWEKELERADSCFRKKIDAFRREQLYYSAGIGLLLFGLLSLFGYRKKFKGSSKGVVA